MAAKTNVYLPTQTWNCTLEVLNQNEIGPVFDAAPTHHVEVASIGGIGLYLVLRINKVLNIA